MEAAVCRVRRRKRPPARYDVGGGANDELEGGPEYSVPLLGQKLNAIRYSPVDRERLVTVEFVMPDDEPDSVEGALMFRFRPIFEWNDSPIFRLILGAALDDAAESPPGGFG